MGAPGSGKTQVIITSSASRGGPSFGPSFWLPQGERPPGLPLRAPPAPWPPPTSSSLNFLTARPPGDREGGVVDFSTTSLWPSSRGVPKFLFFSRSPPFKKFPADGGEIFAAGMARVSSSFFLSPWGKVPGAQKAQTQPGGFLVQVSPHKRGPRKKKVPESLFEAIFKRARW